jgi:hypothetical protein
MQTMQPIAPITGMVATGSTQTTAVPLVAGTNHQFSTVTSGTGAILPVGQDVVRVVNLGANALLVYPPVGGTISGGSINAAVSVSAASYATFWGGGGNCLAWFQN